MSCLRSLKNQTCLQANAHRWLLSVLIFVCAILSSSALAQTPCETINTLLTTLSTVRDIQGDVENERIGENLVALEGQIELVSLPTLFPKIDENQLSMEQAIVVKYKNTILETVAERGIGHEAQVKAVLETAVTLQFIATLTSIDNYWGCGSANAVVGTTEPKSSNFSTQFGNEGLKSINSFDQKSSIPRVSNGPKRNSTDGSVSQVTLNRLVLEGGKGILFLVMLIAGSTLSIFLYFRHQALQSVREVRHLIYLPVISKVGNVNYPMVLVDISMNGGKLKHDRSIEGKPHISFYVGRRCLTGQVKWSNSSYAGVMFKSPLDSDVLNEVVQIENI